MSKRKTEYFNIKTSDSTGEIYIYGMIGDSWFGDSTNSSQFVTAFKYLESRFDRIDIHLNSPGGNVWEGLAIINCIRQSKKDVHIYIDGIAASMAAMIAVCGKVGNVHIGSNCLLMFHNASSGCLGNAKDMRNMAKALDAHDTSLQATIKDRTGQSIEVIQKEYFIYSDIYLTAQEALDKKLVDVIESFHSENVPENVMNMSQEDLIKYFEPKDTVDTENSLFNKLFNKLHTKLTNSFSKFQIQPTNKMNFKNSLTILAKETMTAEEKAQVIAEIAAFTGANEKFTKDEVTAQVTAAVTEANKKVTDAETAKKAAEDKLKEVEDELTEIKAKAVGGGVPQQKGNDPITSKETIVNEFEMDEDREVKKIRAKLNIE